MHFHLIQSTRINNNAYIIFFHSLRDERQEHVYILNTF